MRLGRIAKGLGYWGIEESWRDYSNGGNSFTGAVLDTGFGLGSNLGGWYGAWTGLFYELGKEYGPIHRYMDRRGNNNY